MPKQSRRHEAFLWRRSSLGDGYKEQDAGEELAKRIRVSPQAINQWTTGQLVPTKQKLAQIAGHFRWRRDLTRDIGQAPRCDQVLFTRPIAANAGHQGLCELRCRYFCRDLISSYYGGSSPEEMLLFK
jgi:transcriptional regulator with XRE-family HTH domain